MLGFGLIANHPFVDGNKRIGHAALETFLILNGMQLDAGIEEAEREILAVAAGQRTRDEFQGWIERRMAPLA